MPNENLMLSAKKYCKNRMKFRGEVPASKDS